MVIFPQTINYKKKHNGYDLKDFKGNKIRFSERLGDVKMQNIREGTEFLDQLKDRVDIQQELLQKKNKEIEELNNIINELEKDIDLELYKTRANDEYNKGLFNAFRYVKDKLQELKGDDKE